MAATRTKIPPVGSAPWIISERRQAIELVEQDVEEFEYSVRNEMEWLNEHMGEIFSGNQLNVADIFKTPGKLRGKTPRTARKRNALATREPLTDIFAPNVQVPPSATKTQFYKQIAQIQVAEDAASSPHRSGPIAGPSQQFIGRGKENADSGYHGMTDDEKDSVPAFLPIPLPPSPKKVLAQEPEQSIPTPAPSMPVDDRRMTEESFVSAKESLASTRPSQEDLRNKSGVVVSDSPLAALDASIAKTVAHAALEHLEPNELPIQEARTVEAVAEVDLGRMDEEDIRSPSEGSSPVKPLLRKSSLTFASLPAREPLANKKSIGARASHVALAAGRSSQLGRFTGGKSLGGQQHFVAPAAQHDDDAMDVDVPEKPTLAREESETTKIHNQTTTQRLHDRINMLGQARASKSNPFGTSSAHLLYPQLPHAQPEPEPVRPDILRNHTATTQEDDNDDWIAPVTSAPAQPARPLLLKTRTVDRLPGDAKVSDAQTGQPEKQRSPKHRFSPSRSKFPFTHKKVVSASAIASPTWFAMAPDASQRKAISVSNPPISYGQASTTPTGSPRRPVDGPLSATKAKLYSALRSAKGIFASSAGVSAQAKMEALSPAPRPRQDDLLSPTNESIPRLAIYPNLGDSRVTSAESAASNSTDGRRTRSSSEREKRKGDEKRHQHKAAGELEKVREKERQKAAASAAKALKSPSKERIVAQRSAAPSRTDSARTQDADVDSADEMPPPPPPKSMLPTTQQQRLPRRIAKPTKDVPSKVKPAPVTVRMPSQRIGHAQPPSTETLSQSLQDTLPPPLPAKPMMNTKNSYSTLHSSASSTSLKLSGSSQAAKKALDAAAKKRELDSKAAQRKAEQKREMEQRRAAKAEEERRRQEEERKKQEEERRRQEEERRAEQQRKQIEQQRREEAKKSALRQVAEAKRAEQQRKDHEQDTFAQAMQQEKARGPYVHPRADLGNARPASRLNLVQDPHRPIVQVNPAKPPKRALQVDDVDELYPRTAAQRIPPYQQLESKRRKTNDREEEDEIAEPRRSVMGPPIRQSNVRKENKVFVHGYGPAPPPPQHAASMFVNTVMNQHNKQHPKPGYSTEMAKFANARIPFADAPNPSAGSTHHKTPGRPLPNSAAVSNGKHVKSSPHYPNGENIALPEIATDSEDEDSENEFQAPDWTDSPALREILTAQQLIDPLTVFGTVPKLNMEEVFRNKDRHKKFRDRTSSANWNGADRLTEEERVNDAMERKRMMDDGGWSYRQPTLPK